MAAFYKQLLCNCTRDSPRRRRRSGHVGTCACTLFLSNRGSLLGPHRVRGGVWRPCGESCGLGPWGLMQSKVPALVGGNTRTDGKLPPWF